MRDCQICAAGTFQNLPGQALCNKCTPGSYQVRNSVFFLGRGVEGTGSFQNLPGQALCNKCAPGSYQVCATYHRAPIYVGMRPWVEGSQVRENRALAEASNLLYRLYFG